MNRAAAILGTSLLMSTLGCSGLGPVKGGGPSCYFKLAGDSLTVNVTRKVSSPPSTKKGIVYPPYRSSQFSCAKGSKFTVDAMRRRLRFAIKLSCSLYVDGKHRRGADDSDAGRAPKVHCETTV
jgi:hypothetical protein